METETALNKLRYYCNYQERSIREVTIRLQEWETEPSSIPQLIETMQNEGLIDERRFAITYAGGKFRLKNWGKIKITQGLLRKGITEPLITEALQQIDQDEYLSKLKRVLEKKEGMTNEPNDEKRRFSIARFAMAQGYEPSLVWKLIED